MGLCGGKAVDRMLEPKLLYQPLQQSRDDPDGRLQGTPTPRTLVGEVRGQEKKVIDVKSSMILLPGAKVQSLE